LCAEFAAKGTRIHVVHEGALAVDLHDGEPLPVTSLELGIAPDVDLVELEVDFLAGLFENPARAFAEVAALRVVEDDVMDRCRG